MNVAVGLLSATVRNSIDVVVHPTVATFERHKKRGTLGTALIYVGIVAAAMAGISAGIDVLTMPDRPGSTAGWILATVVMFLIGIPVVFALESGIVYIISTWLGGTGTWGEVAYTFALFSVPLYVVGVGLHMLVLCASYLPVIGIVWQFAEAVAYALYGYVAVRASMNLGKTRALIPVALVTLLWLAFSLGG